ncbi:MAG: putative toxin-antitoxin system toxin component, PIN family [Candidatus Thermoplasmatota archaeon]|nr:putative toxin-antitoxin system toxin component, PIN family [Candidatus Thermoplasmatota archaeon]
MVRIVLDSNILISGFFWNGNERSLLTRCKSGKIRSVTSEQILSETEMVLRKKFHVPDDKIHAFIQSLILMSDLVFITDSLYVIEDDPKDNMVLETAILGKAEYIISGDNHLLKIKQYDSVRIIQSSEFLSGH